MRFMPPPQGKSLSSARAFSLSASVQVKCDRSEKLPGEDCSECSKKAISAFRLVKSKTDEANERVTRVHGQLRQAEAEGRQEWQAHHSGQVSALSMKFLERD